MIGTDENRAVLYVEAIFWSGKRKTPPSLMSGNIVPILSSKEPRNIWGYAFWTEPSVHLMNRPWEMPSPSTRMPWEQAKLDGIDYIALYYVNEKGKPVQILDAELA